MLTRLPATARPMPTMTKRIVQQRVIATTSIAGGIACSPIPSTKNSIRPQRGTHERRSPPVHEQLAKLAEDAPVRAFAEPFPADVLQRLLAAGTHDRTFHGPTV